MAIPPGITDSEIAVGQPVVGDDGNGFARKVKDLTDYHSSQLSSNGDGVPNGSFEVDADIDGNADRWTKSLYTGGAFALDTTDATHGSQCAKFTHPGGAGNGGGYIDSDYIEVSELMTYVVSFLLKNSAAGTKVEVVIRCYDKDRNDLSSDQTIYSSVANPTSWTLKFANVTLAAGTKYIKIRLIGGKNDVNVAGTVRFDGIGLMSQFLHTAGDILIQSADTQRNEGTNNYTKHKEIKIAVSGNLRIKFDLYDPINDDVYGIIRRNGGVVGTERYQNSSSWQTYSEDIGGWVKDDLCQLYIKNSINVATVSCRNFRIYSASPEVSTVTFDA